MPPKRTAHPLADEGERLVSDLLPSPAEIENSDGSRLIRGATVRVLGYATMVVLSVASTAVVTRHLGVSRFGQYATVISVAALVTTITDSGMTSLASREFALLEGKRLDQTLSALLGLRIALTFVGTAFATGFAFAAHYDTALVLGMLAACLATLPLIVLHTLSIPLINDLRLGTLSMLELARQALWAGGLISLAIFGAGALPLLLTLLVANLLLIPVTLRATRGLYRVPMRMRVAGWRDLIGATLVFSIASAVGTVYLYGTQLITSLVANHHQTGLFSLVFRVFIVTTGVPTLVGSAAVPLLARAGRDDQSRLYYVLRRYLEISIVGGLGVALILSAASGFIVPLIGGPRFQAAVPVATIQCFALVGTFIASPCSYGLLSLHLYRRLLAANASALVVTIVVTDVLARTHGALGSAISSICGETTVAVLMLVGLLYRRSDCRPSLVFIAKLLFASACTAPLALGPWLPALPRAVVVAIVYLAMVLLTRALPAELIQALPFARGRAYSE